MTEEFLWLPDQDDNSNFSSSDDDPQPVLKLSSFAKKIPMQSLTVVLGAGIVLEVSAEELMFHH